jgi:hypothetical protein
MSPPASVAGNPASTGAAHPLARAMWAILRDRSVADKALVLAACERRLAPPDMTQKEERSYFAVARFVEEHVNVPHAGDYDRGTPARIPQQRCPRPRSCATPSAVGPLCGQPSVMSLRRRLTPWRGRSRPRGCAMATTSSSISPPNERGTTRGRRSAGPVGSRGSGGRGRRCQTSSRSLGRLNRWSRARSTLSPPLCPGQHRQAAS